MHEPSTSNQPKLLPMPDKREYELLEDFSVVVKLDIGELERFIIKIVVPKYYAYDGASIPWIGWKLTFTPFDPIVMLPALVHDWLYSNHQVDRDCADKIFCKLLLKNGVSRMKAGLMYYGVRIGGASHWENKKEDLEYLNKLYIKHKKEGNKEMDKYYFPNDLFTIW